MWFTTDKDKDKAYDKFIYYKQTSFAQNQAF